MSVGSILLFFMFYFYKSNLFSLLATSDVLDWMDIVQAKYATSAVMLFALGAIIIALFYRINGMLLGKTCEIGEIIIVEPIN